MSNKDPKHRYDNMLIIDRPKAANPMTLVARAAQFSSFQALTGFGDKVSETARLTDSEIELTDTEISIIDQKLRYINDNLDRKYDVSVTYYVPDKEVHLKSKKEGGEYISYSGVVKKIDPISGIITFEDKKEILIERILDINIITGGTQGE